MEPDVPYSPLLAAFGVKPIGASRSQPEDFGRSWELKILAQRLGFTGFNATPNPEFVMGWNFLDCLSPGENRYAFDILEGTYQGQKLFVFDYHFLNLAAKDQEHQYYTILMLIVPQAFPKLTIRAQDLLRQVEGAFDNEDVKFESAEFSKAYRVRCRDKKFAYDVCNPQMMEFLLANRDLKIEIQGPVISVAFEWLLSVGLIEINLQRLAQIRSLMPQYLFTTT